MAREGLRLRNVSGKVVPVRRHSQKPAAKKVHNTGVKQPASKKSRD